MIPDIVSMSKSSAADIELIGADVNNEVWCNFLAEQVYYEMFLNADVIP